MNVILCQTRFEAAIVSGRKPHTIRLPRKDGRPRARVDEEVSIRVWNGRPYCSKQREILRATVDFIFPVRITRDTIHRTDHNQVLSKKVIALNDGFSGWREMRDWFEKTHGLPFDGLLIHWRTK